MRPPFVGRQRELDLLAAVIRRARQDRAPAAALISGEPGSGKTRLLFETVAQANSARHVRVTGFEPMQKIPLATMGELLRQLAKVPGHGSKLEGLVFGSDDQTAADPLRIFEAAYRALSSFGPLLLAIDDLQWVDERSLALVQYLLRASETSHQPLVVIASARPSPAAAAFSSGVAAEMPAERQALLELGPLAVEDGLLLARGIDGGLDEARAIDLWRRAAGSPFWLQALARGSGADDRSHLIGERLRTLSGDAGALLGALAVAARPFVTDDVAVVLAWDVERVRHAARELITRGLALEATGNLQLTHDLIREAVSAALPTAARRRLHARLAEAIEAGAGDDLQMLSEALQHRRAAGLPAATLASRLVASPHRRLLGDEGLELIASIFDDLEPGSPSQVALDTALGELAAVLGAQELAMGRWSRVSEHSGDAATRQHASTEAARAAYRLSRRDEAHAHLDRARASAPVNFESSVSLDALQADIELWLDHETAAGSRTADRALETAAKMTIEAGGVERLAPAQRRAHLAALEAAGDAALQEDRGADVFRLGEMSALVAQQVDEQSYLSALTRAGFALRSLGRSHEAEMRFRHARDEARRLVLPMTMVEAGHGLARCLRDLGHLVEARNVARETVELERRVRNASRRWGNAPSILHVIELSLGDPAAALRALRRDAETEADPHYRLTIHQAIALWQARFGSGRTDDVKDEIEAARAAAALARCPRCGAELSIISAEVLARIGRVDDATRELAAWERQATADYPMRRLWRARAKVAIAMATGDGASVPMLEALIEDLAGAGLLEDLLWARLDLGRTLARSDREQAVVAFTEAAILAERMGAVSQGRLAAQGLRRLGVRAWRRGPTVGGEGLDSLSTREREVARLVADGGSNREIAEALLVSPKTVERHVTNILSKLGLRNRTELASHIRSAVVRVSPDD